MTDTTITNHDVELPAWLDLDTIVPERLRAKVAGMRDAAVCILGAVLAFDDAYGADMQEIRDRVWGSFDLPDVGDLPTCVLRAIGMDEVDDVLAWASWYINGEPEHCSPADLAALREVNPGHAELIERRNRVIDRLDDGAERMRVQTMRAGAFRRLLELAAQSELGER